MPELREAVAAALGAGVEGWRAVAGGDLIDAYAADLAGGTRVFVKSARDAAPGAFTREAAGLRRPAEPGALPVPEVLAVADEPSGPRFLVLEWVPPGSATGATDEALGRGLAAAHAAGEDAFGGEHDLVLGPLTLPNDDPAAYGGHREIDLAMLALFGGPGPRCLAAYEEVAPLAPGHEERVALWQVLPLLAHAALFGGGWGASAVAAMRRYVG